MHGRRQARHAGCGVSSCDCGALAGFTPVVVVPPVATALPTSGARRGRAARVLRSAPLW